MEQRTIAHRCVGHQESGSGGIGERSLGRCHNDEADETADTRLFTELSIMLGVLRAGREACAKYSCCKGLCTAESQF